MANSTVCQSKWKPIVEPRRAKPKTYRQAPTHWLKFYDFWLWGPNSAYKFQCEKWLFAQADLSSRIWRYVFLRRSSIIIALTYLPFVTLSDVNKFKS